MYLEDRQVKRMARKFWIGAVVFCATLNIPVGIIYCLLAGINDYHNWLWPTLSFVAGGALVPMATSVFNIRRFIRPIAIMVRYVNAISSGNLTVDMKKYWFGPLNVMKNSFEAMGAGISALLWVVDDSIKVIEHSVTFLDREANQSSQTSTEVAQAIAQVARSSSQQAIQVQQVMKETENALRLADALADNTAFLAETMENLKSSNRISSAVIEEQRFRMRANQAIMEDMEENIAFLAHKSREIDSIIGTIRNIAGQTNLLALNASIESTKSPEPVADFQAVAKEVRKLALSVATTARKTGRLVILIQDRINHVIDETELAKEAVIDQETAIENTQQVIDVVGEQFLRMGEQMNQAAARVTMIMASINRIIDAMGGLSATTEQTSAGAEQVCASAYEQAALIRGLKEIAAELTKMVAGINDKMQHFMLPERAAISRKRTKIDFSSKYLLRLSINYTLLTMVIAIPLAVSIIAPVAYYSSPGREAISIWLAPLCAAMSALIVGSTSTIRNSMKYIYPAGKLMRHAGMVAEGDLRQTIADPKKMGYMKIVGDQFNNMVSELADIIRGIEQAAVHLVTHSSEKALGVAEDSSTASEQISETVKQMAEAANTQASEMQHAYDLTKDMVAAVNEITQSIMQVAASSGQSIANVDRGLRATSYQMTKVSENVEVIERVGVAIRELEENASIIEQVVEVITDIAEQTNVLALNAAVEATRAGEKGIGFAVVSDEIKRLTDRTSIAVLEIYDLISDIQQGTARIVRNMEAARDILEDQSKAIVQSENVLRNMSMVIKPINKRSQQVEELARVINLGSEKILLEVEGIALAGGETASAAQEVLAITENHRLLVENLHKMVEDFSDLAIHLRSQAGQFHLS